MQTRASLIALLVGACIALSQVYAANDQYSDYSEADTNLSGVDDVNTASTSTGRNSPGYHSGCGVCDISRCEPLSGVCIGGYTLDACGCCPACSRLVGEYCNSESVDEMRSVNGTIIWYGRCGNDLDCVTEDAFVSNLLDGTPQQVKICECKKRGKVCGTDGVTYPSICALKAAANGKLRNTGLQMRSLGTCPFGPIIITKPHDVVVRARETTNALMCEASGYPIPSIMWTFTRADGTTASIPSDDKDLSVITRGGLAENRVSSWVQIMGASKKHEGIYTCYAEISETRAVQEDAQVTVTN